MVPMTGINRRTGRNVPIMLPTVETEKTRPAVYPEVNSSPPVSLITKGVTPARAVIGGAKSSTVPINEP